MSPEPDETSAERDEVPPAGPGRRMLVALAAIVGLIVVAGAGLSIWSALAPGGGAPTPRGEATIGPDPAQRETARRAVAGLAESPAYAPFFKTFAERFPADARQAAERFADVWLADRANAGADRYMAEALRALRQARGLAAARADSGPLGRVFEAQAAMLEALGREDARLCVDFLYGGASDAFLGFVGRNRALMADMGQAALAAILDGQAKRNERPRPDDADFAALEQALAGAGLARADIDALLDGKTPDPPVADERLCQSGQIYLKVLKSLPEELRLKIYSLAVELMARS